MYQIGTVLGYYGCIQLRKFMFRNFFAVIVAYVLIGAFAFSGKEKDTRSMITGRVSPADGVELVMVISGKDTAKLPVSAGSFSAEVKPGVHQLIVDAKSPYKDVVLDNLNVTENEVLDLGEITLKQ
jgi:hypothetical protein